MRRLVGTTCALVLAMGLASCLSRSSESELERHERFTGTWIVEQPYHATYESTTYELRPDGRVVALETVTLSGQGADYVTGSVGDPQAGVRCVFANRWYSLDRATLVVDGNCSDGSFREIVLGFADDSSSNAVDAEVVVVSVGGEDGWVHDDWQWRWRLCEGDPETCSQF